MIQNKIKGVGVALITPFKDYEVDYEALGRMVDYVIEGGVDYIVALGSTAETATMSLEERDKVLRFIVKQTAGRVAIVAGMGGNDTHALVEQLRTFDLSDTVAILSVVPYYNKPSQEGVYRHFMAVAEASPLPIVLYNIPGRTGVNMTPETVARLVASSDKFIGIKEASGNVEQMQRICESTNGDFFLTSGDDGLTVEAVRKGGVGVLSVLGHLYPAQVKQLTDAANEGRYEEAEQILDELMPITDSLFEEGNPVGIKTALSIKGVCGATVRLPLAEGSEALREKQIRLIAEYETSK